MVSIFYLYFFFFAWWIDSKDLLSIYFLVKHDQMPDCVRLKGSLTKMDLRLSMRKMCYYAM